MGTLLPPDGQEPSYAQLYIYGPQEATDRHTQRNPDLSGPILLDLHTMLRDIHPYSAVYKQAYEIMREKPLINTQMCKCVFISSRVQMQDITIFLLWRRLLLLFLEMGQKMSVSIEILYFFFKVVVALYQSSSSIISLSPLCSFLSSRRGRLASEHPFT